MKRFLLSIFISLLFVSPCFPAGELGPFAPHSEPDGSTPVTAVNNGVLDTSNSSFTPLLADGVFTGVGINALDYVEAIISVYSDVGSAVDGLSIEYSADNVSWNRHNDPYTIPAGVGKNFSVQRLAPYFRIVYTNGGDDQAEFELTTILNRTRGRSSSHRTSDDITSEDDAVLGINILKTVGSDPATFHTVDVQHPLPADGDSVYLKDIDASNSDNGGFSGVVTDYFDSLKTVNNDATATNPKVIKIWFNRSLQTHKIGFGCDDLGKSFSNIKIEGLGSGEEVRYTKDLSSDSTKRNSYLVKLPALAVNGVQISFVTADEIGLSNIIIFKVTDVNARLAAISDLSGDVEDIGSFRGAMNVNQALVHRTGINEYFKRDLGAATTLAVAVSSGDTSIDVASATGIIVGDFLKLSSATILERSHFRVTNVAGTVLTLSRPIDNDFDIGDAVTEINISLNNVGTLGSPVASRIQPPSYERWQITRLLITMLDATAMDDGKFGGATALTNGFVVRIVKDGVVSTVTHWGSNQDLKDDMFNVDYSPKAPAGQYGLSGRWTITASQFVADLDGATGDYLEVLAQDDLSVLIDYKIKAQGRLFGG